MFGLVLASSALAAVRDVPAGHRLLDFGNRTEIWAEANVDALARYDNNILAMRTMSRCDTNADSLPMLSAPPCAALPAASAASSTLPTTRRM